MNGFEVLFMAPEGRRHQGEQVLEKVISLASELGINSYTRRLDTEAQGQNGRTHSAHFFELADRPEEVMFVLDDHHCNELIKVVTAAELPLFCLKRPIEYWQLGATT
ncbi:hypothetical protein [Larsenimonas rhizosphaerae]|uniref:DUF190 domain-containing protein n=1 Tax=Larsenimonas rhizosphaerae TaxID=2944682 RepID=A0AA41ZGQ7_9GAMM|nr:hypothetical protein [Larsenimonas rhizosphaerae]MCX2524972.1 hypothetical protein [Larsenimonas rhizosphaerae]